MLTWKYNHPPYLDSADNIYNQMLASYEAGAEYIILFNYPTYPEQNPYGAMTDQHFETLERFWNSVVTDPQVVHGSTTAEAVLVLPKITAGECETPTTQSGHSGDQTKTRSKSGMSRVSSSNNTTQPLTWSTTTPRFQLPESTQKHSSGTKQQLQIHENSAENGFWLKICQEKCNQ